MKSCGRGAGGRADWKMIASPDESSVEAAAVSGQIRRATSQHDGHVDAAGDCNVKKSSRHKLLDGERVSGSRARGGAGSDGFAAKGCPHRCTNQSEGHV